MAALDKIFEMLDKDPDLVDAPDAIELGRLRGEIEFEDVSLQYRTDKETVRALDGVSIVIPPGQTVALVGATGAGKSTFAKLVARFYDPTEGRVLVDGPDLRTGRPSRRSARATSCARCRRGWTPRWASAARSCRRASASSWPSRGR